MTAAAAHGAQPLLAARDIELVYTTTQGPVVALKGLSLEVTAGEFVSVIGPSGCGKSTFLKIVSGLVSPTGGQITLAGAPIAGTRRDIGVVFQQPSLLPWKSVLNNVLIPARVLGLDRAPAHKRAMDLLRLAGLADFAHNYPHELSGGMQQRVGLARGLLHDPTILLMDEPFAALDAMTREAMSMELQRIWMSTGKSVIFITHSIPEAVFLSDRVIVLTGRPGSVADDIAVDLPRPRDIDTMATPRFMTLCNKLRRELKA